MPFPDVPVTAALRFGSLILALLATACGPKRSNCTTSHHIGGHAILDTNRVLASVVRSTECDLDGFMVMTTERTYRSRFFLLDIRDPAPPRPLKEAAPIWIDGGFPDGESVILDPSRILDPRTGGIVHTGFDQRKMRKATALEYPEDIRISPGPRPGRYLIRANIHRRTFPESDNGAWYLFDRDSKGYELLADDSLGRILDVTYRDGVPWALYIRDSLTVLHRPLGSDSGGLAIGLPDTLGEGGASAEYVSHPDSLWLRFDCGNCPKGERVRYRHLGAGEAPWLASASTRPYPALGPLLVLTRSERQSLVLMRKSDFRDTAEFSLSDYLK